MLIKAFHKFGQILNTTIYKVLFKRLYVNPIKSHFFGVLTIEKEGEVVIEDLFRARRGMCINCKGGKIKIGKSVFFNNNVSINCQQSVSIGDNVLIGESVKIYDHDHDYRKGNIEKRDSFICSPVNIGHNVWIGSNVLILRGVTIGDNCIISAGSIVTKSIPSNNILIQKHISEYKEIKIL
ncbi:acyltransferase [Enterobacter hormaechei]|uniref:acyltransferase n=1 Tax=Enterobacter hormaechei TaxID=158836 RepID=UPI00352487FF